MFVYKSKPKHRFANSVQAAQKKASTSDSMLRRGLKAGCGHCGGKKKRVYKQEQ